MLDVKPATISALCRQEAVDAAVTGDQRQLMSHLSSSRQTPMQLDCKKSSRPFLVVLHQASSTPGHIGQWLQDEGYALDIRRPSLGCHLPKTLRHHTGAIVFGGPMSACDSDEFLCRERAFIEVALKENAPLLGVCLGAQLLSQVLGGKVWREHRQRVEMGYYPLQPTKAGAAICDWPEQMYQWHVDGFDLPDGGRLLATSDGPFPNQAYAYGDRAVGVQFHPEITMAMIYRWSTLSCHCLQLSGARARHEHMLGHIWHQRLVRNWREAFLHRWLASQLIA